MQHTLFINQELSENLQTFYKLVILYMPTSVMTCTIRVLSILLNLQPEPTTKTYCLSLQVATGNSHI